MKIPRPRVFLAAGTMFVAAALFAKPPSATPTPASAEPNPLAHWLLQQDGQRDAIALPLGQVIQAATGKRALPFDATNPADAAFLTKLGGVMDRVVPRLNRPNSPARLADPDDIAARVEAEIRTVARDTPGFTVQDTPGRGYPTLHLVDTASGKTYYLAVTLYPSGKREEAGRALRLDPGDARRPITTDGCCLLIGLEHNGKPGNDIAFLNWDVVDVANVPVRAAITFQADNADVYHPGAVLTDGRKGSD